MRKVGNEGEFLSHSLALSRREILVAGASVCGAALSSSALAQALSPLANTGDPIRVMRERNWQLLVAIVATEFDNLWRGAPAERSREVASDFINYVSHLEPIYQKGINLTLTWINAYSVRQTGERFYRLSHQKRKELLNRGEVPGRLPKILWEEEYLLHTAVSTLAMLSRLVINSRLSAQHYVAMPWSEQCRDVSALARVLPPQYPDLSQEYDLCIVDSGAGGSVIAARAAESGLRVILVEEGGWVSPHSLAVIEDVGGRKRVAPPRGDQVLINVYKGAGVQFADEISGQIGGLPIFRMTASHGKFYRDADCNQGGKSEVSLRLEAKPFSETPVFFELRASEEVTRVNFSVSSSTYQTFPGWNHTTEIKVH